MRKVNIYLIDDHRILREGIRALLSKKDGYIVVGEAANAREGIKGVAEVKPDVIFLDISMPELNGLDAITQIQKASPQSKIVILSMYDKTSYICKALSNGVSAYLLKDVTANELFSAIETVMKGEFYLGEQINQLVIRDYIDMAQEGKFVSPIDALTNREREVLQLIAEGKTGKEIAATLNISYKTVEHHRYRVMNKLSCDNIAQLIRLAASEGITPI